MVSNKIQEVGPMIIDHIIKIYFKNKWVISNNPILFGSVNHTKLRNATP
jgi:hypothetical protein